MSDRIFNFHDVFLIITIVECLLLAVYRVAMPSEKRIDSLLLGLFLLIVAVDSISALIMWNPFFPVADTARELALPYLFVVSQLALGPLFFLYIRALTKANFQLNRRQLLHFAPALLGALLIAGCTITTTDLQMFSRDQQEIVVGRMLWYAAILLSISYAVAALISLRRYYFRLKESYSDFSLVEIGWLAVLSGGFLISWGWSLIIILVADLIGGTTADAFGTAYNYIRFALLNALFAYSFLYMHRMLVCQSELTDAHEERVGGDVLAKIQKAIEVQRLHLEPNINIEEFSSRIHLPVKTVSYAINNELGTKFFEFINYHRVEEAKALLADESKAELTVLDILLMSGFSNKSSFHRFFKRMVNMSPTEFRRSQLRRSTPAP